MLESGADPNRATIGREAELAELDAFLRGETPEAALLLSGPPGVGKTTLWHAAVERARAMGMRVLAAQAAEAETSLSFATLSDLLSDIDEGDRAGIPEPQQRAIDIALLRVDATEHPPGQRALALGLVGLLRAVAARGPTMVALDDTPWMDGATTEALAFALRRRPASLRVLLARRPGPPGPLEIALGGDATRMVELGGLSLGATRRLLTSRLGMNPSRRLLRQLFEITLGNPLFILELGRSILVSDEPAIGEELRLPASLDELMGARLPPAHEGMAALLAVALGGTLPVHEGLRLTSEAALSAALGDGLLVEEAGRLRPSHPLLAAAAIQRSPANRVRAMHAALGARSPDPVRRAHHLARATLGTDDVLARTVTEGALEARARGAIEQAVDLAEQSIRLSSPDSRERQERILLLGECLYKAEESIRLRQLIDTEWSTLAPGRTRARAHLLAVHVSPDQADYDGHLEAALRETTDPWIRAEVLAEQAIDAAQSWLHNLDLAASKAREAIALAPGGQALRAAVHAFGWVRILRGQPVDELASRLQDEDPESLDISLSLERLEGIRLAFRGEEDAARALFSDLQERASEQGDSNALGYVRHQLTEVEIRAGDAIGAERLTFDRGTREDTERGGMRAHQTRLLACVAALRGDRPAAVDMAAKTIELGSATARWDVLEARRALGLAAILHDDVETAHRELLAVWSHTVAEGIDDPGAFPVAPDLVEAAIAVGEDRLATEVIERLDRLSGRQAHPWGLASLQRAEGLAAAARGNMDEAVERLSAAAAAYGSIGCRFDAARSLLALGRTARRARKWGVARDALDRAAAAFSTLGAQGWAARARLETESLGGRRPAAEGSLTPSELRAAELARDGRSNKEIAAALFVGVHTVEVHLARAYAKLGIQSRSQIGRALRDRDPGAAPGRRAPIS